MAARKRSSARGIAAAVVVALVLVALTLRLLTASEPPDTQGPSVLTAPDAATGPAWSQEPTAARPEPAPEPMQIEPQPTQAEQRLAAMRARLRQPPPEPEDFLLVVVDPAGRPVAGATVEVTHRPALVRQGLTRLPPKASQLVPASAWTTDGLGRCAVRIAHDSDYVRASKPDVGRSRWVNSILLHSALNDDGHAIMQLEPVLVITGRVLTHEGLPAAGVPVDVDEEGWPWGLVASPGDTVTADDGSFRLEILPPPAFRVVAAASDGRRAEHRVAGATGDLLDLTLRLPGDWWIEGEVLDPRGEPVGAAAVRILPDADPAQPWDALATAVDRERWDEVLTGPDGSFSYRATSLAPHLLVAVADDTAPSDPVIAALDASLPRARVVLRLAGTAAIGGRLFDPTGAPIVDATVLLEEREPAWLRAVPAPSSRWRFGVDTYVAAGRARTDAEGRFRIGDLHPLGTYDVLAVRPGVGNVQHAEAIREGVPAGTETLDLVVSFAEPPREGRLRATVRSAATGEPVDVSTLSYAEEGKIAGAARGGGKNGGQVVLDGLVAGQAYTLTVASKGLASVDVHDLVASEDPEPVVVYLPALSELLVEVTDARGLALPYLEVELKSTYPAAGHHHPRPRFTDAAGRVLFDELDPGTYQASFDHAGRTTTRTVEVAGGTSGHVILTADDG